MKKLIVTLLACYALSVHAQTNHLVISQVYGAGGNTNASYTHDFVELFNPTNSPVSLEGWSLQYAGAETDNWSSNKVNLGGSVAAGKYFLIQLGNPGSSGGPLPAPDFTASAPTNISMSATAGKVALVNNTTVLSGNCPLPNASVVDFVGYGTATDCAEGTKAAATSNTRSISRKNNGCTDSDNNSSDFAQTAPSPRNSASTGNTCSGNSVTITSVAPNPFCVTASSNASGTVSYTATGTFTNSTFNAVLSNATGSFGSPATVIGSATVSGTDPKGEISVIIPDKMASGTSYYIRIESTSPEVVSSQSNAFEIINGAKNLAQRQFWSAANNTTVTLKWINPSGCFDEILIVAKQGSSITSTPSGNGSGYTDDLNFTGNGTSFDGGKVVYKGTTAGQTVTNLTSGVTYYFKAFTRRGTIWSSGIEISDRPRRVPLPGEIVINQFSPDYKGTLDEYVELVNLTDLSFDLSDVILDVVNTNGANAVAGGTLTGTIPPHGYWLILPANTPSITVGQTNAVAADTQIDLGFAPTSNQIGLIRTTDSVLIDGVAYGNINMPMYRETASATNPPDNSGLKRVTSGADNGNNSTDFIIVPNAAIELRNSGSRLANANAVIAAGNYTTIDVTGNATLSGNITLSDKIVLTNGIFSLNDYNLSAATATGGTEVNYIKTSGTGTFTITNVTSGVTFPVGNSTYNPVSISNGNNLNWSVHVADVIAPDPTPFDEAAAVQRTWNVTPSATPTSGATVVFEYSDNDASQIGSRFNKEKEVEVWNYHAGIWKAVTPPQMPTTAASGRKAVTLNNYTLFSPFAIVNEDALLPIHFTNFSARVETKGVQLQFTNISEEDIQHYIIERSANGRDFEPLVQLAPEKNNGGMVTYRWLDAVPPTGNVWYRIKGLETDGNINYTPQVQINKSGDVNTLTVYPNPVHGRSMTWKAALPQGTYQLQVSSNSGQQILLQTIEHSGGNRAETLDLPAGLQPGIYRLQISSSTFIRRQIFLVL